MTRLFRPRPTPESLAAKYAPARPSAPAESVVAHDADEHRSALRDDPSDYKRVGGLLLDRQIVPDADEVGGWDE